MRTTEVFKKNITAFNQGYRRIVNHGGTSSSKNFSILQLLFLIAQKIQGTLISVMSETMPHLKMGAIRDFENIIKQAGAYNEKNINQSDHRYFFGKSTVEFFSADSPGKVTGPRRNILYVNEAINMNYSLVEQAEMRTDGTIFYDYNPDHQFWITDKVFALPDSERIIIKSNYLDNSELSPAIKREIEMKAQRDENFKRVHIDLEFGISEGLIFPNINLIDEKHFPFTDKRILAMDFGFTNDPTTLIDIRINDGKIFFHQLLYQTGMTNQDIIGFLKDERLMIGKRLIVADSAEPKAIEELRRAGFNIIPADKGKDSVRIGIDRIKSYPINITKGSVDFIKEARNYKWRMDKDGNAMNEPINIWNHCWDAARYGTLELTGSKPYAPRTSVI